MPFQIRFGPGVVAEAGATGKLLIDISTTEAEATKEMAARLQAATGMAWIDVWREAVQVCLEVSP